MRKRKQWLLLAVISSGVWNLPAAAAADNTGVLRDTPPQDDAHGHYEQISGVVGEYKGLLE